MLPTRILTEANFEQLFDALQLDNQPIIRQQVNTVSTIKFYLFVVNGQFNLKLKRNLRQV